MKLLTIKIKPLSSFATLPKGDTIFGQIVANDFLEGNTTFINYLNETPKLIVSDMMPFGLVYKPTLPMDCFKSQAKEDIDKKSLRKKRFISINDLQKGDFYKAQDVDYFEDFEILRNSIDRTTFTTGEGDFAPFSSLEKTYYSYLWLFMLVDETIETKVVELLKKVGKYGFGKDASIGKGSFEIEILENPIKQIDTNYYMGISPTILSNQDIEDCWYEPFTRFGKFSRQFSDENVFKKPILMANSSCVIKTDKKIKYFGASLNNSNSPQASYLQGFSIALPINIKDEQCLN